MFDVGWSEMAVILLVALVVIGPRDLPRVARTMGKWVAKGRAMAREFQSALEDMAREAELDKVKSEIEKAGRTNLGKTIENTIDPTGELGRAFDPTAKSAPKPAEQGAAKPSAGKAEAASPEPAPAVAAAAEAVDAKPADAKPADAKPADAKAAAQESADAKPAASKSAGPRSARRKSAAAKPADPQPTNGQAAAPEPGAPAAGNGSGSTAPERETAPADSS